MRASPLYILYYQAVDLERFGGGALANDPYDSSLCYRAVDPLQQLDAGVSLPNLRQLVLGYPQLGQLLLDLILGHQMMLRDEIVR